MDRYHLENPGEVSPDEQTDDQKLIAQSGNQHERTVLQEFRASEAKVVEIPRDNFDLARRETLSAMAAQGPHHLPGGAGDRPVLRVHGFSSAR